MNNETALVSGVTSGVIAFAYWAFVFFVSKAFYSKMKKIGRRMRKRRREIYGCK